MYLHKNIKSFEKVLAIWKNIVYINTCCDMIAMKREVAAERAGVPWSECQVSRKLTTSHCTSSETPSWGWACVVLSYETHGDVYSRRLSYC